MASPAIQRSPYSTAASPTASSPLQRLSNLKDRSLNATTPSAAVITPTPTTAATPALLSPSPASPLDSFASDQIFSAFLSPDFDSARFSSAALSSGSAASRIEKLQEGLRLLDFQLRHEVLSRHEDLLNQLSSIRATDSALSTLRSSVSSLQSSVQRVRSELSDPHRVIATKTLQLSNLHSTTELLQSTIRFLRLSKKLRDLMDSTQDQEKLDISKAAQLHFDILSLHNERHLSGIEVVDSELKWVTEIGQKLRGEGMRVLEKGLEDLNQADVGAGLQVFYNMRELRGTVDGLVSKYKGLGVKSINTSLDMKAVSAGGGYGPGGVQRSGTPQLGGSAKAKEALWQRMSSCMDQLHSIVVAVWHLQRVLSKKRDPFTHVLLLEEVMQDDDPMLTVRIWEALVKSFASQMKSTFTASSFVKETFTVGYPKLLSMIENLLERISRDTDVKGVPPALTSEAKDQMISAIEPFQTAFLALCLSRLSDLVNSVFSMSSRGSIPSKENIYRIISRIQEEIESVQMDARLTLLVLREINKALLLLSERAEYQISAGPEARQVTGPATSAQLKNFALCQHLQEVHARVSSLVAGLPTIASDVLSPALGTIYGVAGDSVTSLFQTMLDRLEASILKIHDQNFGTLGMDNNNASPYMEELQKSIVHFRSEFLSRLLPPSSSNPLSSSTETIC
ncbi:unnamed protein product, partial [Cuscuta europaea]